MGCVSSKHVRKDIQREVAAEALVARRHVVSLTSSTYGALNLDAKQTESNDGGGKVPRATAPPPQGVSSLREEEQPPEVINAWELMEDLEEPLSASRSKNNSPKRRPLSTPFKFLSYPIGSPKSMRRHYGGGKENRGSFTGPKVVGPVKSEFTLRNAPLKCHNSCKAAPGMRLPAVWTPNRNSFERDNGISSRRSLEPLFEPGLVESYEKELTVSHQEEQIKKMIPLSSRIRKLRNGTKESPESILSRYQKKCPPGGENAVVIYTTTLRGIRKTFEDCNVVRSVMESHMIHVLERDISMDSGFKEELRGLMGAKEARVPVVFVKGRMIGGSEQVVKLEEEGRLEIILDGIPRASMQECEGCGGIRFVMCMDCSGSCKVLGDDRKVVKCGECNENGLIHCPICS